jgi:hypothetical protein
MMREPTDTPLRADMSVEDARKRAELAILDAITRHVEGRDESASAHVLLLAESYAWLRVPGSAHGGPPKSP